MRSLPSGAAVWPDHQTSDAGTEGQVERGGLDLPLPYKTGSNPLPCPKPLAGPKRLLKKLKLPPQVPRIHSGGPNP